MLEYLIKAINNISIIQLSYNNNLKAVNISYSLSSLDHGNFEWFGRECEAVHRIIPDLNSRLEADIKPLEDVCQGEKYQGLSEFLSQTSSLADLRSKV